MYFTEYACIYYLLQIKNTVNVLVQVYSATHLKAFRFCLGLIYQNLRILTFSVFLKVIKFQHSFHIINAKIIVFIIVLRLIIKHYNSITTNYYLTCKFLHELKCTFLASI